MIETKN